jgi:hypothetical protein
MGEKDLSATYLVRSPAYEIDIHTNQAYIGQTAAYMLELNLKHGFIATYDDTIFLRKVDVNHHWVLQYSPVIFHDDIGTAGAVSLCQSFWHVAVAGASDADFGLIWPKSQGPSCHLLSLAPPSVVPARTGPLLLMR